MIIKEEMHNKFIVIEGLEGAGKTNAQKVVVNVLKKHGICNVVTTHDPGGTYLAERIRWLIKANFNNERLNDKAELLLLYASRIQLVENVIKPALKYGSWVVSDRYHLSTLAYQGGGRGLDSKLINNIHSIFLDEFRPDLTLYLDITPEISMQRVKKRYYSADRIERECLCFFKRTRERYLEIVANDSSIIMIDATKNINNINLLINKILCNWLRNNLL